MTKFDYSRYKTSSEKTRRTRTASESVIHAVIIHAFCHGNQLNESLKNVNWNRWRIIFHYWIEFYVWRMADATNNGGIPKGLRLVVRFWGAVSGLCECCCFDLKISIFDLLTFACVLKFPFSLAKSSSRMWQPIFPSSFHNLKFSFIHWVTGRTVLLIELRGAHHMLPASLSVSQ